MGDAAAAQIACLPAVVERSKAGDLNCLSAVAAEEATAVAAEVAPAAAPVATALDSLPAPAAGNGTVTLEAAVEENEILAQPIELAQPDCRKPDQAAQMMFVVALLRWSCCFCCFYKLGRLPSLAELMVLKSCHAAEGSQ